MNSKVSVYIPTRNRVNLLRRAVESVKSQRYENIEIVIVDNGSEDGTKNYILELSKNDHRIKGIYLNKNYGACVARNIAITESDGKYITGLDDDDYYSGVNRIKNFLDGWSNYNNIAGLFDSVVVKTISSTYIHNTLKKVDYKSLRMLNNLGNQIFAPKEHFLEVGLFDENMPAWQDWDLWFRMAKKYGDFYNISTQSYVMDQSHEEIRISSQNDEKIRIAMQLLMSKIEGISLKERSSLIRVLHAYPQVKPKSSELLTLFAGGRIRSLVTSLRKFI